MLSHIPLPPPLFLVNYVQCSSIRMSCGLYIVITGSDPLRVSLRCFFCDRICILHPCGKEKNDDTRDMTMMLKDEMGRSSYK